MQQTSYKVELLKNKDIFSKNNFEIPKFQRGISWDKNKRKKFIETFRNGKPFGVILLFQNEDGKYSLVDGLQRISTLIHYKEHFEEYIEDILDKELIKNIYNSFIKANNETVMTTANRIKELENFIINVFKKSQNLSTGNISRELINHYNLQLLGKESLDLTDIVEVIKNDFNEKKILMIF